MANQLKNLVKLDHLAIFCGKKKRWMLKCLSRKPISFTISNSLPDLGEFGRIFHNTIQNNGSVVTFFRVVIPQQEPWMILSHEILTRYIIWDPSSVAVSPRFQTSFATQAGTTHLPEAASWLRRNFAAIRGQEAGRCNKCICSAFSRVDCSASSFNKPLVILMLQKNSGFVQQENTSPTRTWKPVSDLANNFSRQWFGGTVCFIFSCEKRNTRNESEFEWKVIRKVAWKWYWENHPTLAGVSWICWQFQRLPIFFCPPCNPCQSPEGAKAMGSKSPWPAFVIGCHELSKSPASFLDDFLCEMERPPQKQMA